MQYWKRRGKYSRAPVLIVILSEAISGLFGTYVVSTLYH